MTHSHIYIVGLGPGALDGMTGRARAVLDACDCLIGYTTYIDFIKEYYPHKELISTGMTKEVDRCRLVLDKALEGNTVALVSSGDAGVYGMAGIMHEIAASHPEIPVDVIPGVTAACSGAAVLGAPLVSDFCVISLSDLLTPKDVIIKRLEAAGMGDFVVCLYNPSSKKRADYLEKACTILAKYRRPDTPCGLVHSIGRDGEASRVLPLSELTHTAVDMFTTVFIGNSQTKIVGGRLVTPRGYHLGGD